MRLSDIIKETETVSELNINAASASTSSDRPQNFVSRMKTNLQRVNPFNGNTRARAVGIKQLGNSANELMRKYQTALGSSAMETATLGHLTGWMKQQGLPLTGRVNALIKQVQSTNAPKNNGADNGDPASNPPAQDTSANTNPASSMDAEKAKQANVKARLQSKQGLGNKTPSGFGNFVKAGGEKITGANPDGSVKTVKTREDVGDDIPLDNKMVSQIISASVAEKNDKASGTSNQSTATGTSTSGGTGGGSVNRSSNGQQAPAINTAAVVAYYKKLDQNGRKALRTQLDQADAELAKTQQTQSVDPVNEQVGYSRFLGMSL